jgi:hypothetical protein
VGALLLSQLALSRLTLMKWQMIGCNLSNKFSDSCTSINDQRLTNNCWL